MLKKILIRSVLLPVIFFISMSASATTFHVTGKITRTLAEGTHYGKCMISVDVSIANGCPANGWISLDCKNTYSPAGDGDRKFNTALAAAIVGKSVFLVVDNAKKHDGYCVATRLDVIM